MAGGAQVRAVSLVNGGGAHGGMSKNQIGTGNQ